MAISLYKTYKDVNDKKKKEMLETIYKFAIALKNK